MICFCIFLQLSVGKEVYKEIGTQICGKVFLCFSLKMPVRFSRKKELCVVDKMKTATTLVNQKNTVITQRVLPKQRPTKIPISTEQCKSCAKVENLVCKYLIEECCSNACVVLEEGDRFVGRAGSSQNKIIFFWSL